MFLCSIIVHVNQATDRMRVFRFGSIEWSILVLYKNNVQKAVTGECSTNLTWKARMKINNTVQVRL